MDEGAARNVAIRISLHGRVGARVVARPCWPVMIEIRDHVLGPGWHRMPVSEAEAKYLQPRSDPEPLKPEEPDYRGRWITSGTAS